MQGIKKLVFDAAGRIVVEKKKAPKFTQAITRLDVKPAAGVVRLTERSIAPAARTNRASLGRNGHWQFDKPMCAGGQFGFIYLIHDILRKRMYIGKKQYLGTGAVNNSSESNWKWYKSSCTELQNNIRADGEEGFDFYVLEEYFRRGSLAYAETWSLMHVEAPCNRDVWYNALVNKVSWPVLERISDNHKKRVDLIVAGRAYELEVYNDNG